MCVCDVCMHACVLCVCVCVRVCCACVCVCVCVVCVCVYVRAWKRTGDNMIVTLVYKLIHALMLDLLISYA